LRLVTIDSIQTWDLIPAWKGTAKDGTTGDVPTTFQIRNIGVVYEWYPNFYTNPDDILDGF